MTTRSKPSNDYQLLAARFGAVRRAWKRTAALSGLAVVATESIGILTGLLFLDWLYQPVPMVRIALWLAALGGIVYFLFRHVFQPLSRKISDEQIALYIEENRAELDGVLITAAEFGRKREQSVGNQAALIDAIVHEAVSRSARTRVGQVVDFSRLKKYGIGAAAGVVLYLVLSVLFPNSIGIHMGRVLTPWFVTREDRAREAAAAVQAEPMHITLSRGDTSLRRGASFDFEATLSKPKAPGAAVVLFFRPRTPGADWQKLAMTEIEKLNGFQGALPDVSEDLEFYVACEDVRSDTFHLSVFDPLVVQSLETTTQYPDYIKQPDRVDKPSPGDVTALVGSKVTLRILTSTPLKEGLIKWSNGETQPVTVDPQAKATATVSFEVKKDDTYDYTVTDVNGQQAVSAAPLTIHAVPDAPPTVTVHSPQSPVVTNPLGEIQFDVSAGDDFGVVGLDLVYSRIDAKGDPQDTRVVLTTHPSDAKNVLHGVAATYRLALEDANPPFQPNDAIPCHVEARDAKGQVTSSPVGLIIVSPFEHWATWATPEKMGGVHNDTGADLMALLALAWELDNQKAQLQPEDIQKRSLAIANELEEPDGTLHDFLKVEKYPQLAKVAGVINGHLRKAHDALVASDPSGALNHLSIAAAIYAGNGMPLDSRAHGNEANEMIVGSNFHLPVMAMLEQARLTALANANKAKTDGTSQATDPETARQVADLLKQEDELIAHAKSLADAQNPGADKGPAPANGLDKSQTFGATTAAAAAATTDLAAQQLGVADKTRTAATSAQGRAAAANNSGLKKAADATADVARKMEAAARDFAAGKVAAGTDKANEAKTDLEKLNASLQTTDRDQLAAAIGDAARHASVLLDKQKDLGTATEALAKELGTGAPDQRQQRDLEKQAYQQTVLGANAESLNTEINGLSQEAEQLGQPEAVHLLEEAQKIMKRGRPQVRMSNAVVDLNNASPGTADDEQKSAEDSLQSILQTLQSGSDSLAASRAAQLARAGRAAAEAKQGLGGLLAKAGAQGKGDQASGGAQGKGDPADGGAKAKGDQANGAEPGKGDPANAGTQGKPDAAPGGAAGTSSSAPASAEAKASGQGNGGGDDVRQLAYTLGQLAAAVDNRQLVPQDEADQLKQMTMDKAELEKRLTVDPKFLQDVSAVVGTINDKIEAEIAAKSEAGKLFSSQREECPPNYRQLVNKYFEALSQATPASAAPPTTEQPGQP